MADRITVLLPVDAPGVAAAPLVSLADRAAGFAGSTIGVVDNGLWRSMHRIVAAVECEVRERGAVGLERTPFDHLAPDFADQQRALWPFGARVRGAVTGLGN